MLICTLHPGHNCFTSCVDVAVAGPAVVMSGSCHYEQRWRSALSIASDYIAYAHILCCTHMVCWSVQFMDYESSFTQHRHRTQLCSSRLPHRRQRARTSSSNGSHILPMLRYLTVLLLLAGWAVISSSTLTLPN